MKNISIKNIFKKENRITSVDGSTSWPVNFIRDWKVIVLVFAVGLISLSVFAWQIYLSDQIGGGYLDITNNLSNISVKTINKANLQADLKLLENRQSELLRQRSSQPKMVDPSL